jgi:hypothetical protein
MIADRDRWPRLDGMVLRVHFNGMAALVATPDGGGKSAGKAVGSVGPPFLGDT